MCCLIRVSMVYIRAHTYRYRLVYGIGMCVVYLPYNWRGADGNAWHITIHQWGGECIISMAYKGTTFIYLYRQTEKDVAQCIRDQKRCGWQMKAWKQMLSSSLSSSASWSFSFFLLHQLYILSVWFVYLQYEFLQSVVFLFYLYLVYLSLLVVCDV